MFGWTAFAIVCIICLFLLITGISGGLTYLLAPFRGAVNAEVQIESGANRRYTYDHFHNLCASIKAVEFKIDEQKSLLAQELTDDMKRMVLTNVAGLASQRASKIAEYNADSNKAYTSGRFKDSNLPRNIMLDTYNGSKTNC